MYSIRPHSAEKIDLDLPTTMYRVRPIIEPTGFGSQSQSIEEIAHEQDRLLAKIEQMINQLELMAEKRNPRQEELVVHLSVKNPSNAILKFITDHRDRLSLRVYRHSSVSSAPPSIDLSVGATGRSMVLIWSERENLPQMIYQQMKINSEEEILNVLSHELNKN